MRMPRQGRRPGVAGVVASLWAGLAVPTRLVVALVLAGSGMALLPALATATSSSLTISAVNGAFYTDTNSNGVFNATSASIPVFTQTFPVINFNAPTSVVPCSLGPFYRPFTDYIYNGSTCTDITAQNNTYQAGVGSLYQFQAAFTGTFTALGSGPITFDFYSDDGWILGIGTDTNGDQPTLQSGPMISSPGTTPMQGYTVVSSFNQPSSPAANQVVVNFPAPGTYPFEIDYTEVRGGQLALTTTANGTLIPPAPTVTAPANQTAVEGTATSLDLGSFSDALYGLTTTGPWNVDVNWGDGTTDTTFSATSPGALGSQSHTYADDQTYTVTVAVTNMATNESGTATFDVVVSNAPIAVGPITAPTSPVAVNSAITASAPFTDPGTADTHSATWDWGDGTTSAGTVTDNAGTGTGSVADSHTYAAAGVYTITLTVSDGDTPPGTGTAVYQYVVVYDPSAGFVTGGGWIDSPAGADTADPTLTGRAHFGFVSRYQKGNNTPVGQTEFQFQAGNLNFHSSSYDAGSLVVSGPLARYTGTGTVQGSTDGYTFLVEVYDCDVNGSCATSPDGFRIQITDTTTHTLVYDNVVGGTGDLTQANTQPISQGDVVIHK